MGFIKQILSGQKEFMLDLLAPVNFTLLSIAYFLGVGLSRILIRKEKTKEGKSFWVNSNLTKKEKESFLRQF